MHRQHGSSCISDCPFHSVLNLTPASKTEPEINETDTILMDSNSSIAEWFLVVNIHYATCLPCKFSINKRIMIDFPEELFDKVMAVNVRASFLACKYGLPHMNDGGSIFMADGGMNA